jgi:hypothetical protein
LPHHDQQASDDENQTEHGQMLSSITLLLNLIPLIDVTFSTPTGDYTQNPHKGQGCECNRDVSTTRGWFLRGTGFPLLFDNWQNLEE